MPYRVISLLIIRVVMKPVPYLPVVLIYELFFYNLVEYWATTLCNYFISKASPLWLDEKYLSCNSCFILTLLNLLGTSFAFWINYHIHLVFVFWSESKSLICLSNFCANEILADWLFICKSLFIDWTDRIITDRF